MYLSVIIFTLFSASLYLKLFFSRVLNFNDYQGFDHYMVNLYLSDVSGFLSVPNFNK